MPIVNGRDLTPQGLPVGWSDSSLGRSSSAGSLGADIVRFFFRALRGWFKIAFAYGLFLIVVSVVGLVMWLLTGESFLF